MNNKGQLALTIVGIGLQVLLFLQLRKLRINRQFPIFYAYVAFSVVSAVVTFAATGRHVYSYIYWTSEAIYVVLTFLVLQEAFRSIFRNFLGLRWFKWLFPGIGLSMFTIAVLRSILLPRPAQSLFTTTILNLEIGVGFLQFGIFSFFLILIRIFHLRWRQHPVGIVFGFGISAAGSLVAYILRSEFGTRFDEMFLILTPLSYIIGVAVWLATFIRKEPSQPTQSWDAELTPEQMITELRRHTKAVKGILGR
jgi:hypothetical protein